MATRPSLRSLRGLFTARRRFSGRLVAPPGRLMRLVLLAAGGGRGVSPDGRPRPTGHRPWTGALDPCGPADGAGIGGLTDGPLYTICIKYTIFMHSPISGLRGALMLLRRGWRRLQKLLAGPGPRPLALDVEAQAAARRPTRRIPAPGGGA